MSSGWAGLDYDPLPSWALLSSTWLPESSKLVGMALVSPSSFPGPLIVLFIDVWLMARVARALAFSVGLSEPRALACSVGLSEPRALACSLGLS